MDSHFHMYMVSWNRILASELAVCQFRKDYPKHCGMIWIPDLMSTLESICNKYTYAIHTVYEQHILKYKEAPTIRCLPA